MEVKIYKAADAFLYLPIYIAEKRGIFETIKVDHNVVFPPTEQNGQKGDAVALGQVLDATVKGDEIPLAVCDPFVFLEPPYNSRLDEICVLGAIITRVPFWAVDGENLEIHENDFAKTFRKIIYYDEALRTGHYIGKRAEKKSNLLHASTYGKLHPERVGFGEEFSRLFAGQERTVAITCDIVSMALAKSDPAKKLSINHNFATNDHYKDFITTALLTTHAVRKEFPGTIDRILQGIQAALSIIRCSKEIAVNLCQDLSGDDLFYHEYHPGRLKEESDIRWMVDQIYKGNFYPNSLQISREQWEHTIDCYKKDDIGLDEMHEVFEEAKAKYDVMVVNQHLIAAQKNFAAHVGIDLALISKELVETRTGEALAAQSKEHAAELMDLETELTYQMSARQRKAVIISAALAVTVIGWATTLLSLVGVADPTIAPFGFFMTASYPLAHLAFLIQEQRKFLPKLGSMVAVALIIAAVLIAWIWWNSEGDTLQRVLFIAATAIALAFFLFDRKSKLQLTAAHDQSNTGRTSAPEQIVRRRKIFRLPRRTR